MTETTTIDHLYLELSQFTHAKTKRELDLEERIAALEGALKQCIDGFEYTRQYVGYEMLPPIKGWTWFDADQNAKRVLRALAEGDVK